MKRYLLSFFSVSLVTASLLTSCVREVVLDAGEDPQVVVECVLSNDDVQELYLNFTKGASRDKTESLTEAVANLIDITESQIVGQFIKTGGGDLWTLRYTPVSGHDYRLEVQVPGYDLIYAEDPDDMVDYDFMVYGSFSGDWYHYKRKDFREPAPTEGYLVFESLSDNYLAYIRDALYVMQLKESTDMSSIYLRDNIHTNVVGGLGIFAASVRQIQQCANIFRTEIVAEQFLDYGIISENGEYRFADNERYEYPLINPDEWLVKCFAELHPSQICETTNVNN